MNRYPTVQVSPRKLFVQEPQLDLFSNVFEPERNGKLLSRPSSFIRTLTLGEGENRRQWTSHFQPQTRNPSDAEPRLWMPVAGMGDRNWY